MTSDVLDEGDNYRITLDHDVCVVTVWRREDLTSAQGADQAERMTLELGEVLRRTDVRAMILDLSGAPTIMGPRTEQTIGGLLQRAAPLASGPRARGVRVVSTTTATGRMQLERIARAYAPEVRVCATLLEAHQSLRAG